MRVCGTEANALSSWPRTWCLVLREKGVGDGLESNSNNVVDAGSVEQNATSLGSARWVRMIS